MKIKLKIISCLIICFILIVPTISAKNFNQYKKTINKIDKINSDFSNFKTLISQINKSLIKYYLTELVEIGPRYTGTNNCKKAADYIYNEFKKIGLQTEIEPWNYIRYKSENVVATLNGTDSNSDSVIVLCAHYDTITYRIYNDLSVGANDDGSGIAAMLAIANVISKTGSKHTIKFVAVSGEEVGTYGSYDFVKKANKKDENILCSLVIDTIGFVNNSIDAKFINMFTPKRTQWIKSICDNISNNYFDEIHIKVKHLPYIGCDSDSFMDFGYDTTYIGESGNSPYIHSPDDTIENINFSYLTNVTKYIFALTSELANKKNKIQVKIISPKENSFYSFKHKIVSFPGLLNIWRHGNRGLTYIIGSTTVKINLTSSEEILSVSYSIDGQYYPFSDKNPPYEFNITGFYDRLIGKKTLGVHVSTINGETAYDEMDIFIIKPNYNLWRPFPQRERWIK